jgi:hypothetical protein
MIISADALILALHSASEWLKFIAGHCDADVLN